MATFYGEKKCEKKKTDGDDCINNAYFRCGDQLLCGMHSKKFEDTREKLPKNPHRKQDLKKKQQLMIKDVLSIAKASPLKGKVCCFKMKMMRTVDYIPGWLNIFPNFKHKSRTDGVGVPSLSPMSMGPIKHNQPGLPVALNLENFHQGNKVFPIEFEDEKILPSFYTTQRKMYRDHVPHRHKLSSGKKNKPLFSVWRTKDGVEKRFSYIQSRQFYCNYYERFALKDKNFKRLKLFLNYGINIRLCGFDAYVPTGGVKGLEKHYLDDSRPFGHELVLYTLLTVDDPEQYPWRKHKTEEF